MGIVSGKWRLASGALLLVTTQLGYSQPALVSDPRPMMAVADQFQRILGTAVNYEDPRFEFQGDIVDVTDAVVKDRNRSSGRVLIPKGGDLPAPSVTITRGMSPPEITSALKEFARLHEARGYPGRFDVFEKNGSWYIGPVGIRNARGDGAPASSIMTARVRFALQRKTAGEFLESLLSQVSQACGFKIGIGGAPFAVLAYPISLAAEDEPADTVFRRLMRQLQPEKSADAWSYRLLFDPGLRRYVFNLAPVSPQQPAGAVVEAVINALQGRRRVPTAPARFHFR